MATQFILIDRDTPYILPPCVQDYLPEEHMARFVVELRKLVRSINPTVS